MQRHHWPRTRVAAFWNSNLNFCESWCWTTEYRIEEEVVWLKEIITTQVCAIMQRHYLPRTGRAVVALVTTILILTSVLSTEFVFSSKEEKVDTLCKCKRTLREHAKTKWFFDITRSIFFIFEDFSLLFLIFLASLIPRVGWMPGEKGMARKLSGFHYTRCEVNIIDE